MIHGTLNSHLSSFGMTSEIAIRIFVISTHSDQQVLSGDLWLAFTRLTSLCSTLYSAIMLGQYRFQRLLPLDQESRQRNREAIVGQMLRCRNQVASSVAGKLNSTKTVVNKAWEHWEDVDSTAEISRQQSSMGADLIDSKGVIQGSTAAGKINTKNKVRRQ